MRPPIPQTSLYAPVKAFLQGHGFDVKGEVCGCDIVGLRDGEPPVVVVTELKLSFSLELLLQASDRMRAADQVYVAVPVTRWGRDQDSRVHRLCRLLGIGLLTVSAGGTVSVLVEPLAYRPRPNLPQRRRFLAEHRRRKGDTAVGGSTRTPIMTAYRQRALGCAAAIEAAQRMRPRDLKELAEDAPAILRRNVYGWFERVERGWYALTPAGLAAVAA